MIPSDSRERDKFLKHLKQRPPVERPLDYGRQSPRLLAEITDSIRAQHDAGAEERTRPALELWAATPTERKDKE